MTRALILALLLASASASAGEYWFKTGQAVQRVDVVYVDVVTCGEELDAYGCFNEIWPGVLGVISVRRGLPAGLERCVLTHERRHADGDRHPRMRFAFIDCGDGTWISSETLARMKYES